MPHIEQPHHGLAPVWTIIQRPLVHIHPNEPVGGLRIEIAGELHGIGQSLFAMFQSILNAVAQCPVDSRYKLRAKRAADRVSPQWQRQARHLLPPASKVDNAVQASLVIGQLPFMDDQSSFVLALKHLRNDLVERHNLSLYSGSKKLQRKIGGRERARDRNLFILDLNLS